VYIPVNAVWANASGADVQTKARASSAFFMADWSAEVWWNSLMGQEKSRRQTPLTQTLFQM
jgi:hypothetical protein